MSNYVAAIDLGTTKVVTIVGEKTPIGIKIVGYKEAPSSGVMRGEVVNIQKVLNALLPTIKDAEEQIEGYKIKEVYVGIAGQNIRCEASSIKRNRSKPDELITKEELISMMEEVANSRVGTGEQILHVIPQSYNIDEHMGVSEGDVAGMPGKEIQGNYRLFIGKANSAEHSSSVVRRGNLQLKKLILEPIASARALLSKDEMELGVAMVDIGGGTTDLLIYHNNTIRHTAVIPFGGNSITEDIRQICGVSLRYAEILKKKHGSCLTEYAPEGRSIAIRDDKGNITKAIPYKLLAGAIEARVSEIVATVMYEIEKSTFKDKLASGIVITGGTANLNNIMNIFRQLTGYKVRIALPDDSCVTPNSKEEVYKPSASTAVGLVLMGADLEYEDKIVLDEIAAPATNAELFPPQELPPADSGTTGGKKKVKGEKKKSKFSNIFGTLFSETENENEA